MEVEVAKTKKKRSLNLACNFCKNRHVKCDGNQPCIQCISRNEECVFITNQRRGRKPKKALASPIVAPQSTFDPILPSDKSFHHIYFTKFSERVLSLFPMFTPKCFSVQPSSSAICMSDTISWDQVTQLTPTTAKNKSTSEILDCLEYSLLCAHGSRMCNTSNLCEYFMARANFCLQLISCNLSQDPTQANRLVLLILLMSYYNFASAVSDSAQQKNKYLNFQAFAVYNLYPQHVSVDAKNSSVPELEDVQHFVKKIKFNSHNVQANCVNAILAVGSVSFSLCVRHSAARIDEKLVIYKELLGVIEEAESFISLAATRFLWIGLIWSSIKAFVFSQLGLEQPHNPLELLLKLVDAFQQQVEKSPGNVGFSLATVFLLKIVPAADIPQETLLWCLETLSRPDVQFQGLAHLLKTLFEDFPNPTDVTPPLNLPEAEIVWSEEQLKDLLCFTSEEIYLLNEGSEFSINPN